MGHESRAATLALTSAFAWRGAPRVQRVLSISLHVEKRFPYWCPCPIKAHCWWL